MGLGAKIKNSLSKTVPSAMRSLDDTLDALASPMDDDGIAATGGIFTILGGIGGFMLGIVAATTVLTFLPLSLALLAGGAGGAVAGGATGMGLGLTAGFILRAGFGALNFCKEALRDVVDGPPRNVLSATRNRFPDDGDTPARETTLPASGKLTSHLNDSSAPSKGVDGERFPASPAPLVLAPSPAAGGN